METVDKLGSEERLTEILWCDHVSVVPSPLVFNKTPHCFIRTAKVYLVVEQGKIKLLCPECWRKAIGLFHSV